MTGTVLGGRYRLDRLIATGGMGEVWRGHDELLGRTVAVKVMLPQLSRSPGFVERFRGEARHTAGLSHPGIATVYDYGESEPAEGSGATSAYLVMELVEGQSLADLLESAGRLPADRTLDLVAQVAAALAAAHARGVVHRDVKPANLLVRPDGTVVVTDFGIARSASAAAGLTMTGEVMGTAAYLAPEQAEGKPATGAADVYSLGVVAYQCLAGRRPFDGDTPLTIALAHLRETPPPLPADVPAAARAVVERAMAKDPADRHPSATALAEAARAAATRQVPVRPSPARTELPPTAQVSRASVVGYASVPPRVATAPLDTPARGTTRVRALVPALLRTPPLAAGVVAGVVFALLLGLGITSVLTAGSRATDTAGATTSPASTLTSPSPTRSPVAETVVARRTTSPYLTLRAADYVGRPVAAARTKLAALGLRVTEEQQSGWRYGAGTVAAVSPTRVQRGGTVKVVVSKGSSTGSSTSNPTGNDQRGRWHKKDKHDGDDQGDDE